MFNDLDDAEKMSDLCFNDYKTELDMLPTDDHKNGIFGKESAIKQAAEFFTSYRKTLKANIGRWFEPNLLPLVIGGTGPTHQVFAQWLCKEIALTGIDMRYYDESHNAMIDLCRLHTFLDSLPAGTQEAVWSNYILDKHSDVIADKIASGVDNWNSNNEDVMALRHDIKSNMVIVKHHTQST